MIKEEKLPYEVIGKMAETEIPKLLYQVYILRKINSPNIQSFADYANHCYQDKIKRDVLISYAINRDSRIIWQKANANLLLELKPCPFCGNIPEILPYVPDYFSTDVNSIVAYEIRCSGPCDFSTGKYDGRFDQAKAAWNKQSAD